ncbi:nucleolar protein 4 isoform X3 [Sorex araneus]|uniref:nucleolar protein 4 isoform X3 n=1 Tax=Sorex araneus TaxID=42254 RepID=UPI0024334A8D|nr:nucleolar protein 4 isoform X3 [Sorex araneus]
MESERDMYRHFQDWCLRTYGDSGKTKTVTRKKYERIVQLLNGSESSSTDNAKFKFWVKSKGFQLGQPDEVRAGGGGAKQVLYVPVKTTDGVGVDEKLSLRRVAVVEDFFDIIYSMHVETGPNGEQIRKHAGQKRTYKADESSIESDEFDMSDSTRMSAVNSDLSSNLEERMQSPQNLHGQQDDDSAAESFNGNETLGHSSVTSGGTHSREMCDSNDNGKTGLEQEEQPLNLSDSPLSAQLTSEYRLDDHSSNGKSKYKNLLISDLKMERETRENGSKSPAHSFSSYDSGKNESMDRGAEDLSLNRGDEDEDDHDDHDDSEKVNETDGVEAERLKAFNMFVRLFVDENLDRMVPISKQPKEKIQAIIDSCRRQFPEYQERARKRIRTYLKSCRRMKRSGFEMSRPIPSHLTSAVAESILASACESESRNAAKRMRLDRQQDESSPTDKQCKIEAAQGSYSTSSVSGSPEVLYINGNGTYSYHSYRGLGGGLLNLNDSSSSGPTDLSMKRQLASSSGSSSSSSSRPQLSPTEINAVRQLVAGYRESAAFLLRSADELENLILQQN